MKSKYERIVLGIAAMIALVVGVGMTAFPHEFNESSGVALSDDPSLLNTMRSPGGSILLAVAIMAFAAIRGRLLGIAAVVGMVVYLGYGLARIYSMAVDGTPHSTLIIAWVAEIVVGLLLASVAWRLRADLK